MCKNNLRMIASVLFFFILSIFAVSAQTLLGDANADGTVNINDALMVARYASGFSTPGLNLTNADVDKKNGVIITDALLIAQYVAGIIKVFPGQADNVKPVAAFTISNTMPGVNVTVQFNASGSYDSDGSIVSYSWDFDDDTKATGSSVTHSFSSPDDYKVELKVTDNGGLTGKVSQRVFVGRPQGWTQETHSSSADGDYNVVFPQTSVPRIDITISASDYQQMETNLQQVTGMWATPGQDPMYVPCTFKFNNRTWWHVGVRYKGQSTLSGPAMSGKHKLPLHLNFDKFEDTYPEIKNQRFYGFSELRCGNNWYDPTFVRDKVFADMLRAGGVPTAQSAFYRIYIDTGSGPVYWGLYTVFEDHGDEMMKTQFEDNDGNLYKGSNDSAGGAGGFPGFPVADLSKFDQSNYEKKNNEDANDWSDLLALNTKLQASRTNAATWRAGLEEVFDVDNFIRWLAINTAAINFDSYGWVIKNTYFYQDLAHGGRLMHLPWDFNLSFMRGTLNMGGGMGMPITTLSLSLSEVSGTQWPLIRYLMDDSTYKAKYHQYMREAVAANGCFYKTTITNKINQWRTLVQPYVQQESGIYTYLTNGINDFNQGHTELLNLINTRQTEITTYLNSVP